MKRNLYYYCYLIVEYICFLDAGFGGVLIGLGKQSINDTSWIIISLVLAIYFNLKKHENE